MDKVKIAIELEKDVAEDYLISSESLWFEKTGDNYKLLNVPFFINELSKSDIITILKLENGYYKIDSVVKKSGNSTIWVSLNDQEKGLKILKSLHRIGCGYESGVLYGYFAIDVPEVVDIDVVYKIIDEAEKLDILVIDYPSIRH